MTEEMEGGMCKPPEAGWVVAHEAAARWLRLRVAGPIEHVEQECANPEL